MRWRRRGERDGRGSKTAGGAGGGSGWGGGDGGVSGPEEDGSGGGPADLNTHIRKEEKLKVNELFLFCT